ncbi:MAG: uroporphyrinogen decarboxylase [Verrucomicrobiales bacterium]
MKSSPPNPPLEGRRAKSATAAPATNRERFLAACRGDNLAFPPVWLMRQAGRALPEYRALKEKHSFIEIVQTPELATEVTLQPIRRFDFDAAILFSDILVIAEALGQSYRFRDTGGIEMEFAVRGEAEIDRLEAEGVEERLDYVARALALIRPELGARTALIGFAGSPWTLANYMMEGGSASEFTRAKALFYAEPELFERLMKKLTRAITAYLRMQIATGVDAIQIFDTQGGTLADGAFEAASGRWITEIISELGGETPVIVFAKGINHGWDRLVRTGANFLSVDWTAPLAEVRRNLPDNVGVQGNLDPTLLTTTPEVVARETGRILEEMRGLDRHIFNLGHGVTPAAKLECIESVVSTVRSFRTT